MVDALQCVLAQQALDPAYFEAMATNLDEAVANAERHQIDLKRAAETAQRAAAAGADY